MFGQGNKEMPVSEQDLNIVRTTLHLDQTSEYEALEMFRKDLLEYTEKLFNEINMSRIIIYVRFLDFIP